MRCRHTWHIYIFVYDLYTWTEQNKPLRTIYIPFHFHGALLSPDLCSCGCSCELGRAEVMDGGLLIDKGTLLLKPSSSEQGDLGSASDLGIQPCWSMEQRLGQDSSRRKSTGWPVRIFSTCEVVRLAGKNYECSPEFEFTPGSGVSLFFF